MRNRKGNRYWIDGRFLVVSVGVLIYWSPAMGHTNRKPGFDGWFAHQLDLHLTDWIGFAVILAVVLCLTFYRVFLEPDFVKEERRKRQQKNAVSGSDGCGSDGCGTSGCGTGGCGGGGGD